MQGARASRGRIAGSRRIAAACALGLAGACAAPGPAPDAPAALADTVPERVVFPESAELERIAELEFRRDLGGGELIALCAGGSAEVRRRAALALGRFPFPAEEPTEDARITEALARALEDEDPYVRRLAAFGLGQRADPAAAGVLAAYSKDADAGLRARVAEASRRLASPALRGEVLLALRDVELEVRVAAVLAMALWGRDDPRAQEVDRALIDLLLPTAEPGIEVDSALRWRILYALARREAAVGRAPFLVFSTSELALERLFAAQGLAAIPSDPETVAALARLSADPDWRVAVEALAGLARAATPEALAPVLAATESASPHVRRVAFESLGAFREPERVLPKLSRGTRDVSSSCQAAALLSLAKVLEPEDAAEQLAGWTRDQDPVVRAGAAAAAAEIRDDDLAVELLAALAKDGERRVAVTAIEGLGRHLSPRARELCHAALRHPDNGMKLAAVLALEQGPAPEDVAPLDEAVRAARGDVGPEVAFQALRVLGAIGGDAARAVVERELAHPDAYVRKVAREVLRASFGAADVETAPPAPPAPMPVPLPGRDFPRYERNPEVEVVTTRGSMLFELFPGEAPVHVHNFLTLAEAGHYDGLIFHRVVPDFVVQGGDYRGDGNGGNPWNGRALPAELTTRRCVRGSLGMPRNEDPDSGGSQIFVTHRPTPHLDGRYTIFGELRAGGDVLDRIEVGDRILDVKRRGNGLDSP